jgi:hypothetical protein
MSGSPDEPRSLVRLALLALAGAAALWSALMFALVNDDWVVIRLPTMPWNAEPSVAAFEARLAAVMLACLGVGAALASFGWWRANARLKRRFAAEGARTDRMESELEALGRLVSTARDRERGASEADPAGRREA